MAANGGTDPLVQTFFFWVAFLRCIVNAIHQIKKFKHSEPVLQQYSFFSEWITD